MSNNTYINGDNFVTKKVLRNSSHQVRSFSTTRKPVSIEKESSALI